MTCTRMALARTAFVLAYFQKAGAIHTARSLTPQALHTNDGHMVIVAADTARDHVHDDLHEKRYRLRLTGREICSRIQP